MRGEAHTVRRRDDPAPARVAIRGVEKRRTRMRWGLSRSPCGRRAWHLLVGVLEPLDQLGLGAGLGQATRLQLAGKLVGRLALVLVVLDGRGVLAVGLLKALGLPGDTGLLIEPLLLRDLDGMVVGAVLDLLDQRLGRRSRPGAASPPAPLSPEGRGGRTARPARSPDAPRRPPSQPDRLTLGLPLLAPLFAGALTRAGGT